MANRVVISICGEELTFVAEESSSYMQRVGAYVNDKMSEILDSSKVGRTDAAVLTAVNITDELFKAQAEADQLRGQIKGYLDEAGKAQSEVSELKREMGSLGNVNLGAIEEFDRVNTRYTYLAEQRDDVEKAKSERSSEHATLNIEL